MFGFLISFLLIYKARNKINHTIFIFLAAALILKIISEFLFTLYCNVTDIFILIGHLLKVGSSYFIYNGILENGIHRPFDILNYNLRIADNKCKEKELQRKYLEEIVIQNEYCYDLIIDNSSNCISIIKDEKIVYANKTTVNTFKAKCNSDLIGRSIWEFIQTCIEHKEYLIKLKENTNSFKFVEIVLKDLSGNILKFEYSLNNITYRGKRAYLVVLRNISHREEIKQLKNVLNESEVKLSQSNELNRELTEFFSNISHELKTPLNIILGSIQLILQNEKELRHSFYTEKQKKLLYITRQNAYRLVRLVNNLIDISKSDSRYLRLNMRNFNIVSIVEDITLSVCEIYKMNDIRIVFDTNTEEKIMAVDCDKIERIMLNLLSNAMKFTDKEGVVFVNLTDMGEYIQVSVKDTGIGIPEAKINNIFNRFEQVDKTFTRKREGSGIGLALVKSLVELHGGSISVNSKINEGSEFIVNLPVTIAENEEICTESTFDSKVDKISIEFSDIYS
jgi:PAS domain S-box-containing protein